MPAYSQGYPIIVTTQLIPPYTTYLSDYATETRLNIIIQPLDMSLNNYRAKLMLEVKSDRMSLRTNPHVVKEVVLNSGEPQILNGYDVAVLLERENLSISGPDKGDFYRTGRLPEGFYTFTFYLTDYYRDITIAQTQPGMAFLVLNDPPIINEPRQGQKLRMTDPQNILFQWTPRHTGSPNSAFTCNYEFSIYEVLDKTMPAGQVVSTGMPFYTTTIENQSSSFLYGMEHSPLIPGNDYVFRIRAFDIEGRDMFRNNGYSEAIKFTYGQECTPPQSITTREITGNGVKIKWDQTIAHTSYEINYRKEGDLDWYTAKDQGASTRIYDLVPGTKYYVKLKSYCGTFESEWGKEHEFIAPQKREEKPFQCGNDDLKPITNLTPLEKLRVGDIIHAGGFDALVTKVSSSTLPFSGECLVTVPYFGYAVIKHRFTGIKLNTNYEMYEGELESIKNSNSPFLVTLKEYDLPPADSTNSASQFKDSKIDMLTIPPTMIDGTIESVTKGTEANTIVVITTDGNKQILPLNSPMLLADDAGNQYAVDSQGKIQQVPSSQQTSNYATNTAASQSQQKTGVRFLASGNQKYGFDDYRHDVLQIKYNKEKIEGKETYVPWKSIEEGGTDEVAVEINVPAGKDIKITDENDIPYTITTRNGAKTINVNAPNVKTDKLSLKAYYTEKDDEGKEKKITAGQLDVVTYKTKTVKVKIVPVNDAQVPAGDIKTYLDKVYKQAAVNFTVETIGNLPVPDWDLNGNDIFDEGHNQVFSNYTAEMNHIIETFTTGNSAYDEDTYYMFVIPHKPSTVDKQGQMPITKQFGFIFLNNAQTQFNHTIAHELGHGAFKLEHPYNEWGIPEGTTQNLMDYTATGTELYKYQWDWVQEPGWKVYSLLDAGESAAFNTDARQWFYNIVENVRNFNLKGTSTKIIPSIVEKWYGKILYITNVVIGNNTYPRIAIKLPSTNNAISIDVQLVNNLSPENKGFNQCIKIGDLEIVCFEEKPWNCTFLSQTEFTKSGWNNFVDEPCLKYSNQLNSYLKAHLKGTNIDLNEIKEYIVSDPKAIIRNSNSFTELKPIIYLEQGKEVELIKQLREGEAPMSLVKYKGENEEFCTSFGNLTPITILDDPHEYRVIKPENSLNLPYSKDQKNYIFTDIIFFASHECGDYKKIVQKKDGQISELGWVRGNNLRENINYTKLSKEDFLKKIAELNESTVTTISQYKTTKQAACNMCVREALYAITGDPVLFPKISSAVGITGGDTRFGQVVNGDGSAQGIIDDLSKGLLSEYFEEINMNKDEDVVGFWKRIQNMVDNEKALIIGTFDPGHVFMVVPGGLYEVVDNYDRELSKENRNDPHPELGDMWGYSYARANPKYDYVLRIMDCGAGVKYSNGPFYGVMDEPHYNKKGCTVTFYKYIKK